MEGIKLQDVGEVRSNRGKTLDKTPIVTGEAEKGTYIPDVGGGGLVDDGFRQRGVLRNTIRGDAMTKIMHRRLDEDTFGALDYKIVSTKELEHLP